MPANRTIPPQIEVDPRVLPWWFGVIAPGMPQFLRGYGLGWCVWTMVAYFIAPIGFVVHVCSLVDGYRKRDCIAWLD